MEWFVYVKESSPVLTIFFGDLDSFPPIITISVLSHYLFGWSLKLIDRSAKEFIHVLFNIHLPVARGDIVIIDGACLSCHLVIQ